MMKIINAHSALSEPMTEDETRNFLTNDTNNLLMHIGTIDDKGEPNVTVTAFYFDAPTEKIYLTTYRTSKKVQHLRYKNIISYCIDNPNRPYKGVRGKGTVKMLEEIQQNVTLAKKFLMKLTGSLNNPIAKWLLGEIEKGDEIILEITPRYYSTWRNTMPAE